MAYAFLGSNTRKIQLCQSTGCPSASPCQCSKIPCILTIEKNAAYSYQNDAHPANISQGEGKSFWAYSSTKLMEPQPLYSDSSK